MNLITCLRNPLVESHTTILPSFETIAKSSETGENATFSLFDDTLIVEEAIALESSND